MENSNHFDIIVPKRGLQLVLQGKRKQGRDCVSCIFPLPLAYLFMLLANNMLFFQQAWCIMTSTNT
jgi:hypothetical protein